MRHRQLELFPRVVEEQQQFVLPFKPRGRRPYGEVSQLACPTCSKAFTVLRSYYTRRVAHSKSGKVYCSRVCKPNNRLRGRTGIRCVTDCLTCGKQMWLLRGTVTQRLKANPSGRMYCSRVCSDNYHRGIPQVEVVCALCNNPFRLSASIHRDRLRDSRSGNLFCSTGCRVAYKLAKSLAVELICANSACEKSFTRVLNKSRINQNSYCSMACKRVGVRGSRYRRYRKGQSVTIECINECPMCQKKFGVGRYDYNHRMGKSKSGILYCSRACGSGHRPGAKNKRVLVKKSYWTAEQHHWENILTQEGLGIWAGSSNKLEYKGEPWRLEDVRQLEDERGHRMVHTGSRRNW